jgi:DNA anti-recombination protein RmuC
MLLKFEELDLPSFVGLQEALSLGHPVRFLSRCSCPTLSPGMGKQGGAGQFCATLKRLVNTVMCSHCNLPLLDWKQLFPVERRLSRSLQALQAAVSEKAAAVAALSSRLEQQQAEHAQAQQAVRAEFAQEPQELAERAQAEREASTAALQARVTAAERARQEGAAKAEEQERLVKEGKRREARLQETNRALVRLVRIGVHAECLGNALGRASVA